MRKQIECIANALAWTGQEAPEPQKRIFLDLFKKMMSGDGIAGRRPSQDISPDAADAPRRNWRPGKG